MALASSSESPGVLTGEASLLNRGSLELPRPERGGVFVSKAASRAFVRERTNFDIQSIIKQRPLLPHFPEPLFFFLNSLTVVPQMDYINSLFHNFSFPSPAFIILHLCFGAKASPSHKAAAN